MFGINSLAAFRQHLGIHLKGIPSFYLPILQLFTNISRLKTADLIIILIKLFLNSKLDLIQTVEFVKQLLRIQIRKVGKVLLWNQVKSRMNACYSELVLNYILLRQIAFKFSQSKKSSKNCASLQSDTK